MYRFAACWRQVRHFWIGPMNAKDTDVATPGAAPLVPERIRPAKADEHVDGLSPTGSPSNFFPEFFP